jgi:hypothetical protein
VAATTTLAKRATARTAANRFTTDAVHALRLYIAGVFLPQKFPLWIFCGFPSFLLTKNHLLFKLTEENSTRPKPQKAFAALSKNL